MAYRCPECGKEIVIQNARSCPECGYPIDSSVFAEQSNINAASEISRAANISDKSTEYVKTEKDNKAVKKSVSKVLFTVSVVMYIICLVMLYKGYDKITNYYNSENYYSLNKNAYVGGDAYNYIINGTYATGYFTLSAGFMIVGSIFTLGGLYFKEK